MLVIATYCHAATVLQLVQLLHTVKIPVFAVELGWAKINSSYDKHLRRRARS
jgi:hypothetical protein